MKQKKLGEIIKRYREEQRLTRKELANLLKCTAETVRLWEIGRIKPSRRNMLQLYNILGIKLGDGLYEKITDNFFKYGGRELIKKSRKLTIRRVGNRIYLNKNFQKEFTYAVEFSLHLRNKRELLIKPNITTRGFVLVNENEELIHKIEDKAETIIKSELKDPKTTFQILKNDITEELYPYINNLTGRKPIILPIILDIKKENK